MIDVKNIYEAAMAAQFVDPEIRRSDEFMRIAYSVGNINDVPGILNSKVDLMNELRLVEFGNFSPESYGDEDWIFQLKPDTMTAKLGPNLEYGVKSDSGIRLFKNGIAAVQLDVDDKFVDGVIELMEMRETISPADDDMQRIKKAAGEEYEKANPFKSGNEIYRVGDIRDKTHLKNQKQAINKKQALYDQNKGHAIRQAVDDFKKKRNEDILAKCGFSENTVKVLMNGSLTDSGVLYWYPTLLDFCRIFKHITVLPIELVTAVYGNDSNKPGGDESFRRDLLFESWDEVSDGKSAFDDIRNSLHKDVSGEFRPFPISKAKRWAELCRISNSKNIPVKDYKGVDGGRLYLNHTQNGLTVTVGDLGKIFCKVSKMSGPYTGCKCVIFKNGIVLLYDETGRILLTTMIQPPETLVKILKYSDSFEIQTQKGVPVWLLRICANNVHRIPRSSDTYSFVQTPGTRRYIV